MDPTLIHKLARECIAEDWEDPLPGYYRSMNIARFAALVAEECAKVCDDKAEEVRLWCNEVHVIACAQAIRERFKP